MLKIEGNNEVPIITIPSKLKNIDCSIIDKINTNTPIPNNIAQHFSQFFIVIHP